MESREGLDQVATSDPFSLLEEILSRHPSEPLRPWPIAGGAVGFISYDAARGIERLPSVAKDDRPHAEMDFALYSWAINWDHAERRWGVLATGAPGEGPRERARLASAACEREARWAVTAPSPAARLLREGPPPGNPCEVIPSLSRRRYLDAVASIQERIAEGECYEVNLSRRLTVREGVDARDLFSALCRTNPAPFAACIETACGALISSSPERFLRVVEGVAESRPIKGTAPRDGGPLEDLAAAERLRASGKDRAENVMIVDLVRNDLGRVCRNGSVSVPSLCALESYSGVHHLVSTVRGRLAEGRSALDAARALFPPGSMTGAPKIRAMELIESIEPVRRGPYAGAAGYIASSGDADLSVLIRAFVLSPEGVDLQTGGAVVADSDPDAEFEESVVKGARALAALTEVLGRPLAPEG